jgi:cation transporter-like permease
MWEYIGVGYLIVGLAAAGFTLAVFPPQAGYRPPLHWVLLAVLSYIVLWPFLAMIGVGYVFGQWYQRRPANGTTVVRPGRHRHLYRALYEETPN